VTALKLIGLGALATLAFARAQAPAPAMPTGTKVLLGRVVEIGTDAPVGGAVVTLIGQLDASGKPVMRVPQARGLEPLPSKSVMTTSDGDFVFRDLPAGFFTASIRAPGYEINDYPPTVVEIHDGQKATVVRLRIWKYAAIGGRVVDEHGEPVTGIPVTALQRAGSGAGPRGGASVGGFELQRAGTALTDDRGIYRIGELTPGEYVAGVLSNATTLPVGVAGALDPSPGNRDTFSEMRRTLLQSGFARTYGCPTCISNSHEGHHVDGFVLQRPGSPLPPGPDGKPLGFANTYYPGTQRVSEAVFISLGSGQSRTDLDLPLRIGPAVSVSGVLNGPDGPMAHMLLTLVPPGIPGFDIDGSGYSGAISDSRGAFSFLAVAPGEYQLSAQLLSFTNEMTGEGRSLWASQPVVVGDTDMAGLTITMRRGASISGREEFNRGSAAVGPPADRKVITLRPLYAQLWRTLPAVVRPDGTFRSLGDAPGRYLLNASSPPGWFWQTTSLAGKPLLDDLIDLGATEISNLVITFGEKTNGVSGRVTDATGAPDPDAAVIVFPADSNTWREGIFSTRHARKVVATSAGSYAIETLAPGEYHVVAISPRLAFDWQSPSFLERLIPGATRVVLGAEEHKTVPLRTFTPAAR
jgi:protocatechuate 3,4-dioxygenase beta subunit